MIIRRSPRAFIYRPGQPPILVRGGGGSGGGGGGVTDHGALTGLTDDDHSQYALADGSRGNFATVAQGALADSAVQPATLASYQLLSAKGVANGYASLDSGGQIPAAQIPSIAVTEYLGNAADQTAMLALSGEKGDWCTRTDTGAVWIITGDDPSDLADWTQVTYPASPVTSVAGKTGVVTIAAADISDASAAGQAIMTAADAAAQRTALGLGTAATTAATAYATAAQGTTADNALQPSDIASGTITARADDIDFSGGSDGDVLTVQADGSLALEAAAAGGLSHFTESQDTSAPNATVYVDALTAGGVATNIDAAFVPKGTGAVIAAIPDSTASGGNKRGTYAVDLSTSRTAAGQVASGNYSVIAGGRANTASNTNSAVLGGQVNVASGTHSTVIGGQLNTASASASIAGGSGCTASDVYAVALGFNCSAPGHSSFALGHEVTASGYAGIATGWESNTWGVYGSHAHASGERATPGDTQTHSHVVRATTTDATATKLTARGAPASIFYNMLLRNNSVVHFRARVVAMTAGDATKGGSWLVEGTMCRAANAASTALIGATTITPYGVEATLSTAVVDVVADTTNGTCCIEVTGVAATTIYWAGSLEIVMAS